MDPLERADPPLSADVRALVEAARTAEREARRVQARALYERALRALNAGSHAPMASALMRWIGRTHGDSGDADAALDCFLAAAASAEAAGDPHGMASALNSTGGTLFTLGELDRCEELFTRARDLARESGDDHLVAMVEQNLASVASVRGNLDLALVQYQSSLAGYRRLGLEAYVGPLLNNMGRILTDLGVWDAAEAAFDEARESCRAAGDLSHQVLVEVNRARLHLESDDPARARKACEDAFDLARESGDDRWIPEIHRNYGVLHRSRGAHDEALDHLGRARAGAEARRETLLCAEVAREEAAVHRALGQNRETLLKLNEARRLFERLRARRELADVGQRLDRLEEEFFQIVRHWGESIESKDAYTQGHCTRVSEYACGLAGATGMDESELTWFEMGALLHDVGKVEIPLSILNKPGPLTMDERRLIERHPVAGVELLEGIEFPWDVRPMVRHHHERWDGDGYPDRLAGRDIPFPARILAVADVFDALTSTRSYRAAFDADTAMTIMRKERGTAFDAELLDTFDHRVLPGLRERGELAATARGADRRDPHEHSARGGIGRQRAVV